MTARQFTDSPAVRSQVPLLVGITGPSGSGKTGSALELAHGFQEIAGGDIGVIDSEARRALHFAGMPLFSDPSRKFAFRHCEFKAPFGPLDYMAAIEHFLKSGVKNIVVDSTSHLHEGPGGTLESHATEVERIMKAWNCSGDKANFPAWNKPKSELRKFINFLTQQQINIVLCFRAKEKMKVIGGKPVEIGWRAISDPELIYEMMLSCLLHPGSDGRPTWVPEQKEERDMVKLPQQFRPLFNGNPQLSASIGRQIAEWAVGGKTAGKPDPLEAGRIAAGKGSEALKAWWGTIPPGSKKDLKSALDGELKAIAAEADKTTAEQPGEETDDAGPIPPPRQQTFADGGNPDKL